MCCTTNHKRREHSFCLIHCVQPTETCISLLMLPVQHPLTNTIGVASLCTPANNTKQSHRCTKKEFMECSVSHKGRRSLGCNQPVCKTTGYYMPLFCTPVWDSAKFYSAFIIYLNLQLTAISILSRKLLHIPVLVLVLQVVMHVACPTTLCQNSPTLSAIHHIQRADCKLLVFCIDKCVPH